MLAEDIHKDTYLYITLPITYDLFGITAKKQKYISLGDKPTDGVLITL